MRISGEYFSYFCPGGMFIMGGTFIYFCRIVQEVRLLRRVRLFGTLEYASGSLVSLPPYFTLIRSFRAESHVASRAALGKVH